MSGGKATLWKDEELDDQVGAVIAKLEQLKLLEDTLVIVGSDNGPVLDDGYEDGAVGKDGAHTAAGPFSSGKYSKLEGGTRVPMIISWLGKITPAETKNLARENPEKLKELTAMLDEIAGREITNP